MIKKQRFFTNAFKALCFFVVVLGGSSLFSQSLYAGQNALSALPMSEKTTTSSPKNAFSEDWLALGHYQPTLFGGYKSSIDSPNFFLAKDGKTNPQSEYQATIELFLGSDSEKKCLFPARYLYLTKNGAVLPPFPACSEYQTFQKDLNPAGVTLLYTDAYMNNPASLFGHTLMRIDIPEGRTQLVAHGMNYGAFVDPDVNGVLFAVYGLTGGYWGGFTVKPYYNVINMYNNIENRDIWEFQLKLTPQERDFYVAHLWEVGQTQTRYYFFTKNCSYLLMEVLDAVRPSLRLAEKFKMQTIPLDTLKAVAHTNLLGEVRYRPSRQKRLAERYARMTSLQKKKLVAFLENPQPTVLENLPEADKIAVLDAAYEYVQYQWTREDIDLKTYRQKSFAALRQRQQIATASEEIKIEGSSPLDSHESARVELAVGSSRGRFFQELSIRPAYHALTDAPAGLLKGAEINFLDTTLRYYPQTHNFQLKKADIVRITSLSPYNALFHPLSYQVNTFVERLWNTKTNKESLFYTLRGGSGLTFETSKNTFVFGLVNTIFTYGGQNMPHNLGLALSLTGGFGGYFKGGQFKVEAEQTLSDNWFMQTTAAKGEVMFNLNRNWGVGVSYDIVWRKSHSDGTFKTMLRRFF